MAADTLFFDRINIMDFLDRINMINRIFILSILLSCLIIVLSIRSGRRRYQGLAINL